MSDLCRVCISESTDCVDLSEYREGLPISVITMIILPVKIQDSEDLSLPKRICGACLEVVVSAFRLRAVSLNSEQFLRTNVCEAELNIKSESDEKTAIFVESGEVVADKEPERAFACELCDETFRWRTGLDSHVRTAHEHDAASAVDEEFSENFRIDFYRKDKTPKTSLAWRYFGKLIDERGQHISAGFHYCAPCLDHKRLTKYRSSTATSTILTHLHVVHGVDRQDADASDPAPALMREKYVQKQSTRRVAPSTSETTATICSACGKTFSNHHILNKHMKIHSGQSFSCDLCPAKFTYVENLIRHQKCHEPNHLSRYVCDTCGNSFAEIKSLRNHVMRVHLNIPIEKNFACTFDGCTMRFASRFNLKKHMMTHTDLKPHECQYCGTAYASKGDLFKHLQKNHVGDALYNCEHCPATFRLKIQLRDHYKVHYKSMQEAEMHAGSQMDNF